MKQVLAEIEINETNFYQPRLMNFIPISEEYAIDETGSIFQICDLEDVKEVGILVYIGVNGMCFNWAEDSIKNVFPDLLDIPPDDKLLEYAKTAQSFEDFENLVYNN